MSEYANVIDSKTFNGPLWRTSFRRAIRRPFQYILFIIGVAIGVAMMVSIDLANRSATRAFEISTDAITGRATHRLFGGPTGIDEAFYFEVRQELGYTNSAPVVEGYVTLPAVANYPLRVIGVDPFAEPPFRDYLSTEENRFELDGFSRFLTEPNTILIAESLAAESGIALGDEIMLDLAGVSQTVTVIGLLEPRDSTDAAALENLIFTDISTAQELLDMRGRLSHIDLIAETDSELAPIMERLPTGTRVETAAASSNAVTQMTAAFQLNLTALSLLALVVGMFLIYNTVTFSVVQRRPMFGILRCLGVTGQQLFRLIIGEAIVLSLIGSIIGLGLGILLGRGLIGFITQTINNFYFVVNVRSVMIDPMSLARGVLFGVLAAIIASFFPALEALRTAPNAGLKRSTLESKINALLPYLMGGWLVFGLLGVILLWIQGGIILSFAGLFAVLFAFAIFTPPVTAWLMRVSTPLMQRIFGPLGRIAARDIVRSLSRTSIAIAALMTAVSVVVGVSIMIGSFRGTVVSWLNQTLRADIYISPPTLSANAIEGEIDPEILNEILSKPEVALSSTSHIVSARVPDFDRDVRLVAVSGDIADGSRPYAWLPDGWTDEDVWREMAAGNGIIISEPLVLREDISYPPPPMTISTPEGDREFPVMAVFYDYASDQGSIWMNDQLYGSLWDDYAVGGVALFVTEETDIDLFVDELRREFDGRQELVVSSNRSLRQNSIEIFDRTFAITSALRLLAIIVAFIGVLSALMALQLERSHELGVLRATGMTIRQLWQLTFIETGLMGLIAGLIAIPTGYALAWILIYVINVRSFGWTLQMQLEPSYFIQAVGVSLVAALLAAVYPSMRLGQMVIAAAIRQD